MIRRFKSQFAGYSNHFWVLVGASFIDRLGGALIFPFLALYVTQKFNVGMTEVGTLFAMFSIASFLGNLMGGALTDRFGRKAILICGLLFSALSALSMGFINNYRMFYTVSVFVGLMADMGGPAHQAMVADLLPNNKRSEGYGIMRVVANLAVTIGPAIGGLVAGYSYVTLFVIDAVMSTITAFIVFFVLPETKPKLVAGQPQTHNSLAHSFAGYWTITKDRVYMIFIGVTMIMVLAYQQMNTTLSVYLRDIHGISPQGYGYILSLNALMVVLFQFWITSKVKKYPPMTVIAIGTLLYAVGFSMYGFVGTYPLFLFAMVIITIGEMLQTPISQSLLAQFAPEDMRGRYMALYGFSWIIPSAIGPLAAGLIMDNLNPNWVWYACGILGVVSAAGFALMRPMIDRRTREINSDSDSAPSPMMTSEELKDGSV